MDQMLVILKNDLAELDRLAEATEQFGSRNDWPVKVVYRLNLSLDELVTNVISYGYEDGAEHRISIHFSYHEDHLTLVMQDDARPFNPIARPDPDITQPLEERGQGGLGIFLVRQTMDTTEYERRDGRNVLTMHKKIQREVPQSADGDTGNKNR